MRAVLLCLLLCASPVRAATLRPYVQLGSASVRISDLFEDFAPVADRVLGPSPAPGGRILVEAPQLAAIARQFGIDWRPSSGGDRAVLERPGVPLPQAAIDGALRAALTASGAPADAEILAPGVEPPLVAPDAQPRPEVASLSYDPSSGRFTALLSILVDGTGPAHMRVSGQVTAMCSAAVLTRRLLPGSVVSRQDVQVARIRASLLRGADALSPAQVVGMALRHELPPGQPLAASDLVRPALVARGARVRMQLTADGITIVAQGESLEQGGLNDRIRVRNPASRAVVEADVIGENLVRVDPDTQPVQPPASGLSLAAMR
jgi:flagella basal body P-ring formation protein FlgA